MATLTAVDYDPFAEGAPTRITVTPNRPTVPDVARPLLKAIAGGESPDYNVTYGGGRFDDYSDHPRRLAPITSGLNAGRKSSAAGLYQFLAPTWDEVSKEAGLTDFSPESQDAGAWHLAQKTYKTKTGRDLEKDLTNVKGNPHAIAGIGSVLSGVWTSLPGGIEPNSMTHSFAARYDERAPTEFSAQRKLTPVDYDPFAVAPPSAGAERPPVDLGLPPDTGGRFTDGVSAPSGENFRTAREGAPQPVTRGKAAVEGALRSATFNFLDEITALAKAGGLDANQNAAGGQALVRMVQGLYGKLMGDPETAAAYQAELSKKREETENIKSQQPGASLAGEIGGVAATLPLTASARGLSTGGQMLQGARQGAAYGTISGVGEGTDAESRLSGGVLGGAVGGLVGGAAPPVVSTVLSPFTRGARAAAVPTAQELKSAARAGYESAEIKGLTISPAATSEFSQNTRAALSREGLDDVQAKGVHDLLAKLEAVPTPPAGSKVVGVTGQNIDSLRKSLGNMAGETVEGKPTANAKAARDAIEALDDFIPGLKSKDVLAGDPAAAAAKWEWARGNWAAAQRSENIDQRVIKAQLRAEASNSGMNIANTIRQRMADIVGNKKQQRGYSADEIGQMEQIVRGTRTANAVRMAGNMLGGGGGLGSVVAAGVGGYATADQGHFGAAAPAIGYGLRVLSNRGALRDAAKLSELIRTRAPLSNAVAALGEKAMAFHQAPGPKTIAAAALASRNLANNLKDAGINLSPTEIMRALQGPVAGRADEDQ